MLYFSGIPGNVKRGRVIKKYSCLLRSTKMDAQVMYGIQYFIRHKVNFKV